jgi:hypothetical protein
MSTYKEIGWEEASALFTLDIPFEFQYGPIIEAGWWKWSHHTLPPTFNHSCKFRVRVDG